MLCKDFLKNEMFGFKNKITVFDIVITCILQKIFSFNPKHNVNTKKAQRAQMVRVSERE